MKECRGCNNILPLSEFYRHSEMADGHLNFCRSCVKSRVNVHRYANLDRVQEYDRRRGRTNKHREQVRRYAARNPATVQRAKDAWAERNRYKRLAHFALNNAVRDGLVFRQPCEVCGNPYTHAHHDDYSRPLAVRWLCVKHHALHHVQEREVERKGTC